MSKFNRAFFCLLSLTCLSLEAKDPSFKKKEPMPESSYKSGMYVGIMEGISYARGRVENEYVPDSATIGLGSSNKSFAGSNSSPSFVSDFIVGGRYLFKNGFFPGFEVALSLHKHRIQTEAAYFDNNYIPTNWKFKFIVEREYSFVPSLVLGWGFENNFHIFCKLGLGISRMTSRLDQPNNADQTLLKKQIKYSFVPAIGVEYAFSPRFSILGTFSYEHITNLKFSKEGVITPFAIDDVNFNKANIRVFTQKIGLLFKF